MFIASESTASSNSLSLLLENTLFCFFIPHSLSRVEGWVLLLTSSPPFPPIPSVLQPYPVSSLPSLTLSIPLPLHSLPPRSLWEGESKEINLGKKREYFIPCYISVQKLYSPQFSISTFMTSIRDALKDIKLLKGELAKTKHFFSHLFTNN